MNDLTEAALAISSFLNNPVVRAGLACISISAFLISLLSLRRTYANTAVEQSRYIEGQWQAIYHLTLNNSECAAHVSQMFDYAGDPERARKGAALLMYINVLASTFMAYRRKLIDRDLYESHMKSFFLHFTGNPSDVEDALSLEGYDKPFISECRRFMALGQIHRAARRTVEVS